MRMHNSRYLNLPPSWNKQPDGWLKCSVGASWVHRHRNSEAAWILRDHRGRPSHHSRRALSGCSSICETELQVLFWSLQALKDLRVRRVIIESSFAGARDSLLHPENFQMLQTLIVDIIQIVNSFVEWSLEYVVLERNRVAMLIASSVPSGILQPVVLSGLTSLSEKKHPSTACSHRDVTLWFLLSSQLPFESSVHVMSLWRLRVLSFTFLLLSYPSILCFEVCVL
ncbi:hypothetical protein Bca4012_013501 [Brassica carinata]